MKIIQMFGKREFVVTDEEAKNIAAMLQAGPASNLIELRSGDLVNPKGIMAITNPPEALFWEHHQLLSDGRSFIRDGQCIRLGTEELKERKLKPDPRYEIMRAALEKKLSLSDGSRTEAQEEAARDIRKSRT